MSIQKADKQMEITCVPDTQVMNVQEVIDDHEERIAATPQKPHIKSAAFDWDSKCRCGNMYPKLKYICLPMCLIMSYRIHRLCWEEQQDRSCQLWRWAHAKVFFWQYDNTLYTCISFAHKMLMKMLSKYSIAPVVSLMKTMICTRRGGWKDPIQHWRASRKPSRMSMMLP